MSFRPVRTENRPQRISLSSTNTDRRRRQHVAMIGHTAHLGDEIVGGLRRREPENAAPAHVGAILDCRLYFRAERLKERLLFLVQHETKGDLRQIFVDAQINQAARVIAKAMGRVGNPALCFRAHDGSTVQHTIHRGDADTRRLCDIPDRRPACHVLRPCCHSCRPDDAL